MSRFDSARWGRILAWTGAGLTWGAALTAAKLEPLRDVETTAEPQSTVQLEVKQKTPVPSMPAGGLVILRYAPVEGPEPEVRTVYVRRQSSSPAPARAAASPTPPPAPRSGGS